MRIMGILIIIGMTSQIQIGVVQTNLEEASTYLHTRNLGSATDKESMITTGSNILDLGIIMLIVLTVSQAIIIFHLTT
jgi:hypothetical protein